MAEIPDSYAGRDSIDWRASAEHDAIRPDVKGFTVSASTALHTRLHFENQQIVEQYFGPDAGLAEDGLSPQLRLLPTVVVADTIYPLYDGFAPGAVVHPTAGLSPSLDPHMITLCPRVAAALTWHLDPGHVFNYLDESGRVMATTLYWRDGGVQNRAYDTGIARHGYILMTPEDSANQLRPYLAAIQVSRAWHAIENHRERRYEVTCGSHVETA
jgi:hypothetical protein